MRHIWSQIKTHRNEKYHCIDGSFLKEFEMPSGKGSNRIEVLFEKYSTGDEETESEREVKT